jgi:ligand-binding sensor domain-containing protein
MLSRTIPAGVRTRIRSAVGIVTLTLCASLLFASADDRPLLAYAERTWQMQDGLPEQIVQAFAQTKDRYLWIGTTGGVLRFDGARFTLYNRENTPAFSDNNIFCLMVSRDNTLWIGTEGGGLIQYRDGAFRSFSSKDGLTNSFVRSVYQDSVGRIWIGTDNGLFQLHGERLERVDDSGTVPLLAVHAIYEDRGGGLWAGGSRLVRLKGNSVVEYRLEGEASQNRVKSIIETTDGSVWVGTVSGLHRKAFASGVPSRFKKVREVGGTIRFLRQTSDGALWIGTIGHGLYIYRDGSFSKMTAPERLPSNTVLNLFEDVEQNIWVGTQAGMLRLSNTPVRTVALPNALDSDAETVYEDRGGDVWIAAADLFRYRDGKATPYRFQGISGVRVRNVFRDREGTLWVGTEGRGIYRQIGEQLFHYTTKEGLVNNFIRAFLESRDGSVWIATDEGVSRWRAGKFTNFQMSDGLCYFSTRSLLEDWRRQHHVLSLAWPRRRPFRQRSSRSRGDLGRISTWTTPIVFGSSRCLSCWTCCAVSLQDPVLRLALRQSCPRRSPENLIADESRAQQHRQNADPEKGNDDHFQWTQHNCRTLSRWEESRSMCSPSLRRHSSKGCDR